MAESQFNMPKVLIPVEIDPESLVSIGRAVGEVVAKAVRESLENVEVKDAKDPAVPQSPENRKDEKENRPVRLGEQIYQPSIRKGDIDAIKKILERMSQNQGDSYVLLQQIAESVTLRN